VAPSGGPEKPLLLFCPEEGGWHVGVFFEGQWVDLASLTIRRQVTRDCDPVYRPRFVRHRIESYAAIAADESWFCRMAAGVWNPCRSMSQVVL
jgi:hypothetical protein